ncbi:MAG: recombinase family protein [Monoglobaceae bacterium]
MRVGYCRVSTAEQNTARQEVLLESLAVDRVFLDKCSGKNTDRPALKEMLAFVRDGDTVVVESISRLARNTKDLLSLIDKFTEQGVGFISQKESIDTSSPTGKFILTVFGAIAELEREYILQRQAEGIAIAKANGVYKGRKPIDCPDFDRVFEQVQSGIISATRGWELLGISKSSWYRRVREKQRSAGNQSSV